MNSKSLKRKMIEVHWEDICSYNGWRHPDETYKPLSITSIGYLIVKDKEVIIISQSFDEQGQPSDVLCIPLTTVKKTRYLK